MQNAVSNLLDTKKDALNRLKESYALRQPLVYVQQLSQRVDELLRQMQNYLKGIFQEKKQLFQSWVGKLETLSPLGILERGYSVTTKNGKIVKDAAELKAGDEISVRLHKGKVIGKVVEGNE